MASQSARTRSNTARIPINAIDYDVGADDDDDDEWDADAEEWLDDDGPDPVNIEIIGKHLCRQLSTVTHRKLDIIIENVNKISRRPLTTHHVRLADFLETYHTWASCYLDGNDRGLSDSIEDIAIEFGGYTMKQFRDVLKMLRYWRRRRRGVVLKVVMMWLRILRETRTEVGFRN